MIRADLDDRSERMNAKIRLAQTQKIPYMLVLGDKEIDARSVAIRLRDGTDLGLVDLDEAVNLIRGEIDSKS